ncbi:MAG TPA: vWA domain-containing protein [Polyangiaceae bacterium]|jgi:hypothetical protein|nr:vWA domain-containing protein [Polyangiaceae bacterium]
MRAHRRSFLEAGILAGALAASVFAAGCSGASRPVLAGDDETGDDAATGMFGDDGGVSIGTPVGDAGCATASSQAKRQPVYLEFVLDGSGSMRSDNKWTAVVPALQSIFAEMKQAGDPGVAAGLVVFSDTLDVTSGSGPYPSRADVPVGFVDAAQQSKLDARLTGMPEDSTPTHAALTGGYGVLEGYQAAAPVQSGGKKVLVLITDGVPSDDCATNPFNPSYSTNPCIVEAGGKLEEGAPKGPVETFVLGVGDFSTASFFGTIGIDPSFLGNLAVAGGTGPASCNPDETTSTSDLCYFEIDPSQAQTASALQQKFEAALNAIRGQVVSCVFPLQSSNLGAADPAHVNVEVNGMTILQDPKNGWTYDDPGAPTEIILHGAACTSAQTNLTASVSVVLGCATQMAK